LRPGTGTSGSASFQSFEEQTEPEPEPTTFHYEPEPEEETQLLYTEPEPEPEPEPKPITNMAEQGDKMEVDHEGKSYLKKPEAFTGNRRKVDDFIHACDLFFEGSSPKDFPTDKQKIIFILSYMSGGEALRWRKNYMETEIKGANGAYVWPTKADFLETFKTAFLNEDKKEESIRKLDNINQGN
jgi:hypothetical protein